MAITHRMAVILSNLDAKGGKEPLMHLGHVVPRGACAADGLCLSPGEAASLSVDGLIEGWHGGWWRITADGREAFRRYCVLYGDPVEEG